MKIIPFKDALKLLDRALDINVPGYDRTTSFILLTDEGGAENFLELELEDEYHEFFFRFSAADNQTVKVEGDVMTLVYSDALVDGIAPTLEIRLLTSMQLEPKLDAVHEQQCKLESSLCRIQEHCQEAANQPLGAIHSRLSEIARHAKEAKDSFDWLDNFTVTSAAGTATTPTDPATL